MASKKVVLLGIDGADWRLLKPMLNEGTLKTFSEIIQHGSFGVLKSTVPPLSIPAWTSIFTGVNPGKHGLTGVILREDDSFKIRATSYRMVNPIWLYLDKKGFKSSRRISSIMKREGPNGILIVEHFKKEILSSEVGNLVLERQRKYGDTILALYRNLSVQYS